MIKAYLYGNLGETFGKEWEFDAENITEVFKGIDANTKGFLKYLTEKSKENFNYTACLVKKDSDGFKVDAVNNKQLEVSFKNEHELHVFPVAMGAGEDDYNARGFDEDNLEMMEYGIYGVIGGYGLKLGGEWILDNYGDSVLGYLGGSGLMLLGDISMELGTALIMQGLISALQHDPDPPENEDDSKDIKSSTSFNYQNPDNNVTQGARVPIGYGRLRVGSHVISSSVLNSRLVLFDNNEVEENDEDGNKVGAFVVENRRS